MKKTYIQPKAIEVAVKSECLMEVSAGFGNETETQFSKEQGSYLDNDDYFGW
ncbi:MAG: hypothetical protein MJZ08_01100 [Bacteroidaceae bacterium]|nr:hypothetical protein [Bacteroidaceae bacterium]